MTAGDDPIEPPYLHEAGVKAEVAKAVAAEWSAQQRDEVAAQVAARKLGAAREDSQTATAMARQTAELAAETALLKDIHSAYIELAKSSLDRALSRATYLTTAAGSIVTLYTGLLALVFGLGEHDERLPARGVIPALFLGAAIVFATAYVAFLSKSTTVRTLLPTGIGGQIAEERLRTFLSWTFASVVSRAWALRVAVLCLGVGVATLPAPFIEITAAQTSLFLVVGAVVVVVGTIAFAPTDPTPSAGGVPDLPSLDEQ